MVTFRDSQLARGDGILEFSSWLRRFAGILESSGWLVARQAARDLTAHESICPAVDLHLRSSFRSEAQALLPGRIRSL